MNPLNSSELREQAVNLAYKLVPLPSGCSNCWGDLGEGCTDECRSSSAQHSEKIDYAVDQIQALIAKHTQEARIEGAEAVRDATFDDTQDNASWHREPFECLHRLIDKTVATLESNINKEN